jgi:hypothetical protein
MKLNSAAVAWKILRNSLISDAGLAGTGRALQHNKSPLTRQLPYLLPTNIWEYLSGPP